MTSDTMVTVQGWLGTRPQLRQVAGNSVASFRWAARRGVTTGAGRTGSTARPSGTA